MCANGVSTSSFADLDDCTTLDGTGAFIAICVNAPQEILLFTSALFRRCGRDGVPLRPIASTNHGRS